MMVSLGVGGVAAGIMHLLAHGFFKALLFLGSGSVIHASHHEQDIRKMGGLRKLMPVTFLTYAVGMMALSGVPLFFAGAWTKEEVLHATAHWPKSQAPYYLTLAGVVLTALYMTRQMIYVFYGNRRTSERVHERPAVMTRPLVVLAICTIGLSAVLTPAWPWLRDYLAGESPHLDFSLLIQPMLFISLALVAGGIGLGNLIYRRAGFADPLQQAQPGLFRFLENKMWLDELYAHTIIALSKTAALVSSWMDRFVWDGVVRGVGGIGRSFGSVSAGIDERGINAGVDESAGGARGIGRLMSRFHSGQIQLYLGAVAVAVLALLLFYAWLA
jgi:NADH-quinone oxidoreductase subunit L